ncbi:hypothetical protein [Pseudonocardia acidicola]
MATGDMEQTVPLARTRHLLCKVPEATVYFWIIKVLTTGMGEAAADYLDHALSPVLAVALAGVGLVASLTLQFTARRYVAWIYWLAIVMVSVFGTLVADGVRLALGLSYLESTLGLVVVLALVFAAWYASEKTLSIHSIHTRRREFFYWAAVMTTFALGTAAGDLTARTLALGYLASGVLFAVVIAVPAVAHLRFGLNAILAFWLAYIVTRPLGASFADWAAVPPAAGGLGLGTGTVSVGLAIVILGLVGFLSATRGDVASQS